MFGKAAKVLKMFVFFSHFGGFGGMGYSCLFGFGRFGCFCVSCFCFLLLFRFCFFLFCSDFVLLLACFWCCSYFCFWGFFSFWFVGKLPFPERGEMGVFGPRDPLLQEMGIQAPVWGQGNPKPIVNYQTRSPSMCHLGVL